MLLCWTIGRGWAYILPVLRLRPESLSRVGVVLMALAFTELLVQYEQFLRVEKNLAPKTRRAYLYDLERFQDFLKKIHGRSPALPKITPQSIRDYLNKLQMERGYKSSTLARTIASIRIFFEFCVMRQEIDTSPAAI